VLAEVTSALRAKFPQIVFGFEYGDNPERWVSPFETFGSEPAYLHNWQVSPTAGRNGRVIPPPLIAELETLISHPAVKLLVKDRHADPAQFRRDVAEVLGDQVSITYSASIGLLEIGAVGVTKASGLAYLAAQYGVDASEVAVVGDMPNDLPMFAWAGHTYAVANAHASILEIAQYRLPSNNDDGVAELIETLLAP
jgi:hydroxymethylpyrimidine pyrophosphatase-like HAD family hydrolase